MNPKVSIGVPVYNGERSLAKALDALLSQTYADFELIISDNCSTDATEAICRDYAKRDARIRYIRQAKNLGAAENFKFLVEQAQGEYYMWAACDDLFSADFVEVNLRFLEENPDYVAATSPNTFEGREDDPSSYVTFPLEGDFFQRFRTFLAECWRSHGIYYSLMRISVLREFKHLGIHAIAADWMLDLHLASRGGVGRTKTGLSVFGVRGVSNSRGAYKVFRRHWIEVLFPLLAFTKYAVSLWGPLTVGQRLVIAKDLARLNAFALFDYCHGALYSAYRDLRTKIGQGNGCMGVISCVKRGLISRARTLLAPPAAELSERVPMMQGLLLAKLNRERPRLGCLADAEFSAFSQWGEDGIIDWLVERLPGIPSSFVEFGVGNYRESNTRFLIQARNWRGLIMDGSADHIADIRAQEIHWRYGLTAKCAFIDRDSINSLIGDAGFKGDIGLLSVDIDGNDYWVWQAIDVVNPAIVITEYNAVFGDLQPLTVPYRADFQRTQAHHSNLYFGASLAALIRLGREKGYSFVGTNSNGCNAFFVRDDLAPAVLGALDNVVGFPSSVRESRDAQGGLTFADGLARLRLIEHLPVVDVEDGSQRTIRECGALYSPAWQPAD